MNVEVNKIIPNTESNMVKSMDSLKKSLNSIRTGRASLSLLDGVLVDYYNTMQPLSQVSTLSIPESNMIVIQPWDMSIIGEIEKAIQRSNLGLNPQNDGKVIRIVIPPLTEERRKQLVKVVKSKGEDFKVAVRNIRRDSNAVVKKSQNDKEITEDEARKYSDEIQKLTDKFIDQVDTIIKKKESEIMEF
jgi:ribosome recycling factor